MAQLKVLTAVLVVSVLLMAAIIATGHLVSYLIGWL
jgi:hypothetical protein